MLCRDGGRMLRKCGRNKGNFNVLLPEKGVCAERASNAHVEYSAL